MASIYSLKPKFQSFLRPISNGLVRLGIRPNHMTITAFVGSMVMGGILLIWMTHSFVLILLPLWLFIRMALNAIDGLMAREHQMTSSLGAILNEAGDILSDAVLYLPLMLVDRDAFWPILLFVFGAILTEVCGLLMRRFGASRRYDGPMGKSDRAFFVGGLSVITAVFSMSFFWWRPLFLLALLLEILTCVNRVRKGLSELEPTVVNEAEE